jgi:hypothetical protein
MILSAMRHLIPAFAISCIFANVALCQTSTTSAWEGARAELANPKQTVYVITIAHPKTRHTCLVQSVNASEIVCAHYGRTTTFRAGDVGALILRGEHARWYLYAAGFLAAGGGATWATVALSSVCIPCAAATGLAALVLYTLAPMCAMMTDGDSPDQLLYLAPGQTLRVRLR